MSPTLFEQPRGLFNPPQETDVWKSSEMGPYSFSSLSKTTTKSNCFQMSLQRQHFLVSYLKTLSVGLARVLVRPGCWSGQGVGPARVLVRPGCWSGQGVGLAGVLVRPGCWSGQGVGPAGVLVWPGCWSGQGVGLARVLVRPVLVPATSRSADQHSPNWTHVQLLSGYTVYQDSSSLL